MRGIQIADALSRLGVRTEVRVGPSCIALQGVHDSVIVCVKSCPRFNGWLRRRGNRIVYDAIDFTALRGIPAHADVVITGSEYMRSRLQERLNPRSVVKTVYHHADPQVRPHKAGEEALRLAYLGAKESSKFIKGEIPELNVVSFAQSHDWREEIRNYNAHFSARMDPYKSVVKLANAAASEAVFLTGAEPGCVELLGEDYPFFLRDPENLDQVRKDVKNLKDAVGTALWKNAGERIREARSRLTIEASARAYEKLIADLP